MLREAYHAASDYAEKYKYKFEIKKLKAERQAMSSRLGTAIYTRIVIDEEPLEKPFSDQEIASLLHQIQDLDDESEKIGNEPEKH